jgi:hypothetical protein
VVRAVPVGHADRQETRVIAAEVRHGAVVRRQPTELDVEIEPGELIAAVAQWLLPLAGVWQHERVIGLMRAVLGRLSPKLTDRAVYIVDGFVSALRQLPDARNLALFVFWTAVYWGANGYGMSFLTKAFDCSNAVAGAACEPLTLTVFQGFVVLSVLIVGLMIPAAPGSAGTFQAFALLGMSVFVSADVVNSSGVAYANVLWVVQILQQVLLGGVFMLLSNGSFKDIAGKLSSQQDKTEKDKTDKDDKAARVVA